MSKFESFEFAIQGGNNMGEIYFELTTEMKITDLKIFFYYLQSKKAMKKNGK